VYFFGAIKLEEFLITQGLLSPTPQQMQRLNKTVKYVIQSGHDDRLPKVPSDADIQKMIDAAKASKYPEPAKARNIAIILFLAFSGCRNQEACSLRVGDIDLVSRTAVVEGKGRKDRTIHFTQPVADALLAYWKVRGWYNRSDPVFARHDPGAGKKHMALGTQGVRFVINEIEEAAGLEGLITPHKFRHHFATALLAATGDLALVQDELGHSSADTTRIYTRLVDQQRADKYHKAFGE
jgi:site-specific recombinase XerD